MHAAEHQIQIPSQIRYKCQVIRGTPDTKLVNTLHLESNTFRYVIKVMKLNKEGDAMAMGSLSSREPKDLTITNLLTFNWPKII
jgi:hypothetical protein